MSDAWQPYFEDNKRTWEARVAVHARSTFPNTVRGADGGYRFTEAKGMVPMMFSLEASRP
jgi:hypothetical protein